MLFFWVCTLLWCSEINLESFLRYCPYCYFETRLLTGLDLAKYARMADHWALGMYLLLQSQHSDYKCYHTCFLKTKTTQKQRFWKWTQVWAISLTLNSFFFSAWQRIWNSYFLSTIPSTPCKVQCETCREFLSLHVFPSAKRWWITRSICHSTCGCVVLYYF